MLVDNFTPNRDDLTGGVKSKTHRRGWVVDGFYGFDGCSLERGRVCVGAMRSHAHVTYPYHSGVKSVKSWFTTAPSCENRLTPPCKIGRVRRKIGCKIGVSVP